MKLTMSRHLSLDTLHKRSQMYQPNVGEDLDIVKQDHCVITHPATNKNRRTLVIKKENGSWGFTLQSYGIHHREESTIEYLTYVDYVELGGPADLAGMRKGDIILSVNGHSMENVDHHHMVAFLRSSGDTVRMVVLFEDCSRKVELHLRYMKLKSLLMAKEKELFGINKKLSQLKQSMGQNVGLESDSSTNSDTWGLTPTVNALATLPRKPNQLKSKGKSREIFGSKKHLVKVPINGQLYLKRDGGLLTESGYSTEIISCSDCYRDIPQVCDNDKCLSSSGLLSTVSDSRCNEFFADLSTEQYNNVPLPQRVKRPRSLDVPQITISVPTHDTQYSSVSGSSLILTSNSSDSGSSESSLCMSTDHLYTPDTDASSIQSSLNVSDPHLKSSIRESVSNLRAGLLRRSMSFRGSFHQSISPSQGMSYLGSSNHVITEQNSRIKSDPELIRFRKGHLDLISADYMQRKQSPLLFRSISSPAMKAVSPQSDKNLLRMSADDRLLSQLKPELAMASTPNTCQVTRRTNPQCPGPLLSADCLTVSTVTEGSGVNLTRPSYNHSTISHCPKPTSRCPAPLSMRTHKGDDCCSNSCPRLCSSASGNHTLTKGSCLQSKPWYSTKDNNRTKYMDTCITHDKNGNVTSPDDILTQSFNEFFCSHGIRTKQCSEQSVPGSPKSQPCSAGSDFKSWSLSESSSELSSQSTGSSESVSVSSGIPTVIVTIPNAFDAPLIRPCLSRKQLADQVITYSRYKDFLNNINEEDECTKL